MFSVFWVEMCSILGWVHSSWAGHQGAALRGPCSAVGGEPHRVGLQRGGEAEPRMPRPQGCPGRGVVFLSMEPWDGAVSVCDLPTSSGYQVLVGVPALV